MDWLQSVFSGKADINARGIAGLVVMVLGAALALLAGRLSQKRMVALKLIGAGVCALGAVIVIAFGKY